MLFPTIYVSILSVVLYVSDETSRPGWNCTCGDSVTASLNGRVESGNGDSMPSSHDERSDIVASSTLTSGIEDVQEVSGGPSG